MIKKSFKRKQPKKYFGGNDAPKVTQPFFKRFKRKRSMIGIFHIYCTKGNIFITITTTKGKVLGVKSAGNYGFVGAKRSSKHAANSVTYQTVKAAKSYGVYRLIIRFRAFDTKYKALCKQIGNAYVNVIGVQTKLIFAHNGCRMKKPRRI